MQSEEQIKEIVKSAIVEVLQERRDYIRSLLIEAIEDLALSSAIKEGEVSPLVSREQIFELLETGG